MAIESGKVGKHLEHSAKIGINKNVIQFIFNFSVRHGKCGRAAAAASARLK